MSSWSARKFCAMTGKKLNPQHSIGEHWRHVHRNWEHDSRWTCVKKSSRSNIVVRVTSHDFSNAPLCSKCYRFVILLGGGNNRRSSESSTISGMAFILSGFIAGVGSLFWKSFSNKLPDQRTVTQPILAGSESRKTVLLGLLPGLLLLRVRSRKQLE